MFFKEICPSNPLHECRFAPAFLPASLVLILFIGSFLAVSMAFSTAYSTRIINISTSINGEVLIPAQVKSFILDQIVNKSKSSIDSLIQ